VRPLRRPHDPHRLVLHVPRLRHEHRLQLIDASPHRREKDPGDGALLTSRERLSMRLDG
jgi:hypothetical protein